MATLDQVYNKYRGQAVLIPGGGRGNNGQCAQWADTVLYEVYGRPYYYTSAAIDWWNNFKKGPLAPYFNQIPSGAAIKKGDYIIYDRRVGSISGHIDVASRDSNNIHDFWAYDSNWGGPAYHNALGYPILHEVHHNDAYDNFVVGYIRLKEVYPKVVVVTVPVLNVRNQPTTKAPLAGSRTLTQGTQVRVAAQVIGESVAGNNKWYRSMYGNYIWSGGVR